MGAAGRRPAHRRLEFLELLEQQLGRHLDGGLHQHLPDQLPGRPAGLPQQDCPDRPVTSWWVGVPNYWDNNPMDSVTPIPGDASGQQVAILGTSNDWTGTGVEGLNPNASNGFVTLSNAWLAQGGIVEVSESPIARSRAVRPMPTFTPLGPSPTPTGTHIWTRRSPSSSRSTALCCGARSTRSTAAGRGGPARALPTS